PWLEISQIRRRLVLPGGHQIAIRTQEIVFLADDDVAVVFGGVVFVPEDVAVAGIKFFYWAKTRERMIGGGGVVVHDVRIASVEIDTLQDDGLVVVVQRYAARFVGAGALEIARLDLQRVEAAVAVRIEPFPDRVARKGRLDLGRPLAPIGVNAA